MDSISVGAEKTDGRRKEINSKHQAKSIDCNRKRVCNPTESKVGPDTKNYRRIDTIRKSFNTKFVSLR